MSNQQSSSSSSSKKLAVKGKAGENLVPMEPIRRKRDISKTNDNMIYDFEDPSDVLPPTIQPERPQQTNTATNVETNLAKKPKHVERTPTRKYESWCY